MLISKSKLISYRQCPKKLWLELNRPELSKLSDQTDAAIQTGYQVGDIAQQIYDPKKEGVTVDRENVSLGTALKNSHELLQTGRPIFEAGFSSGGALAFADILLPESDSAGSKWRMIEVKASTSVKDYHYDDVAIQSFVAKGAGVELSTVSVAHIDSSWVYPGDDNYQGLLVEEDLTESAFARNEEVKEWVIGASELINNQAEPQRETGSHCYSPFECGFVDYCTSNKVEAKHPVNWLPRIQKIALKSFIEDSNISEMRDVPDQLLNDQQLRVKNCTLTNTVYFDANGAKESLKDLEWPLYFLDFETVTFAVPIWAGTRPYQQIPFQFSLHIMEKDGTLTHNSFLDLSGNDPSRSIAESLIKQCGHKGSIIAYNASFEQARIRELSDRYADLTLDLISLNKRFHDLMVTAKQFYYHPMQKGSWSIKNVLPAISPELSYETLQGVKDGGMAMDAFKEAINSEIPVTTKTEIQRQLINYCYLDTLAMVEIWNYFTKHNTST